jgi:hypothetical protein
MTLMLLDAFLRVKLKVICSPGAYVPEAGVAFDIANELQWACTISVARLGGVLVNTLTALNAVIVTAIVIRRGVISIDMLLPPWKAIKYVTQLPVLANN